MVGCFLTSTFKDSLFYMILRPHVASLINIKTRLWVYIDSCTFADMIFPSPGQMLF